MNHAAFWTRIALDAVRRDHTAGFGETAASPEQGGPTLSSRALALVHLAMNDAYFSIIGTRPTWLGPYHPPASATSADVAMAAAADAALRALYAKAEQVAVLDATGVDLNAPTHAASIAWGRQVAAQVIAARAADVANISQTHGPSTQRFCHRPDPFNPGQGLAGQNWGKCPPFSVPQMPLAPPPHWHGMGTAAPNAFYAAELEEVMGKGALSGSTRTPDETVKGIFWAHDGAQNIGTPPRLYCQIALSILDEIERNTPGRLGTDDYLEVLTLMTVAMADAGIQAWHWKYHYDLWRPVVGIREDDPALGSIAVAGTSVQARSDWAPLGAPGTNRGVRFTPNFPAYPSGHATFGAAALQVLRLWLEKSELADKIAPEQPDTVGFDFVSDEYNGLNTDPDGSRRPRHVRHFPSLWKAIVENAESRVYLGVHWRFDGLSIKAPTGEAASGTPQTPGELGPVGGVRLGIDIAATLMKNGLRKIP